ncbi:MAG: glycosyltransferase family protein [Verrucomicrobiota bacterium]
MSTVAIIQARMGSTRLPGKVLKPLAGRAMLWHIVNRVKAAKGVDSVMIATSIRPENDVIRDFCAKEKIACHSGSEDDVLDRFYQAAKGANATTVLRLTADCPLADPDLIGKLVAGFRAGSYDHFSVATGAGAIHETQPRFPDGLDCEVFPFAVLERAWKEATKQPDREHVTPFIWRQGNLFKLGKLFADHDMSKMRLTVDRPEDFEVITQVYAALYRPDRDFILKDVLEFLEKNPKLKALNESGIGHEGYEKLWNA